MIGILGDAETPRESKHSTMAAYNQLTFDRVFPAIWTEGTALRDFLAQKQSVFITSGFDQIRKFGSPATSQTLAHEIQGLERAVVIDTEDYSPLLKTPIAKTPLGKLLFQ